MIGQQHGDRQRGYMVVATNNTKTVLVGTKSPINYPPMGSLYMMDALEKNGIDCTSVSSDISQEDLEKIIDSTETDTLNMSVITSPEIGNTVDLSRGIKKSRPDVKVIWGGIHPTINTEQCIGENYIDNVITGNAEETLPGVLKDIRDGKDIPSVINSVAPRYLDKFSPAWNKLDNLSQFIFPQSHSIRGGKVEDKNIFYYLSTSRGCPYTCSFCNINTNGKWVAHSAEWTLGQVDLINKRLKEEGVSMDGIGLWDDMFWINKKRSDTILNGLKDREIGYLIEARADQLMKKDSELVEKLKDTGCMQVFIGAESGSQSTLDYLNKRTKVEDYNSLIRIAGEKQMPTRFSLIVGFPHETDSSVNKTLDFSKRINDAEYCSVSGPKLYTPYPGTLEFNRATEVGFKAPVRTEDWGEIHRRSDGYLAKFPWLEKNLKKSTLKRMEKEIR